MASAARCPRPLLAPLWHAHRHTFVVVCCLCRRCVCCPSTTLRPCRPDRCPNSCPPSQWSSLLSRRLLCSRCLAQSCMQDWFIVVWKASIYALPRQPDHRSPPLGSCCCPCRGRPLIVVFSPPLCPRWPGLHPPSQLSSSRRHPCCGCATTAPEAVAVQQMWWQRSDGSTAMTAQQWQRSNGREGGGAAMAMAAQQRQWRCSNGDAAMATAAQRW